MALSVRTKLRETIDEGVRSVAVTRPADHQGARSMYGTDQPLYTPEPARTQPIEVRYTVTKDVGMLRDLLSRAARNKSGRAVRGPAVAGPDGGLHLELAGVDNMIRQAANLTSHRNTDGPLTVTVKLLAQPEPYVPVCRRCGRTGGEHLPGRNGRGENADGTIGYAVSFCPGEQSCIDIREDDSSVAYRDRTYRVVRIRLLDGVEQGLDVLQDGLGWVAASIQADALRRPSRAH